MFRGRHELSIDPKGRLAIPAKFRDVLSKNLPTKTTKRALWCRWTMASAC